MIIGISFSSLSMSTIVVVVDVKSLKKSLIWSKLATHLSEGAHEMQGEVAFA